MCIDDTVLVSPGQELDNLISRESQDGVDDEMDASTVGAEDTDDVRLPTAGVDNVEQLMFRRFGGEYGTESVKLSGTEARYIPDQVRDDVEVALEGVREWKYAGEFVVTIVT